MFLCYGTSARTFNKPILFSAMNLRWCRIISSFVICFLIQDVCCDKVSPFKHKLKRTTEKNETIEDDIKKFGDDFVTEHVSDLGITVPPEYANETVVEDSHAYYTPTFYSDSEKAKTYWVDMESANIHAMLSNSHRQATTVELPFEFPFYGNPMKNITIATGGFLYMGDYLHNWIAATQYIAPLMANFDTSQSADSVIKYADNGNSFTVQWTNISLQNKMNEGAFNFQVTLHKNGDVAFAYKDIPYPISNISDSRHPVKIGISDAYILERSFLFVRRKTIYEYHRIDMLTMKISNNTALYFTALPTCVSFKDCDTCVSSDPKLECSWCAAVGRCSDGVDRQRQSWVSNGCLNTRMNTQYCPTESAFSSGGSIILPSGKVESTTRVLDHSSTINHVDSSAYNIDNSAAGASSIAEASSHFIHQESSSGMSTGAVVIMTVCLLFLVTAAVWVVYAYKYPHTASGQFLIKYRPSQWSLKKPEVTETPNGRQF